MDLAATLAFSGLLTAAAASDVARWRIPNGLTAALALSSLVLAFPPSGAEALARAGSFALVGGAALALYAGNALGGGDVKLLAATALWIPIAALPPFVEALAFAGGVQALWALGARRLAGAGGAGVRTRIPYGVSIAAAGLVWMLARGMR